MSQKGIKKLRQMYRRDLRDTVTEVTRKNTEIIQRFKLMLRPKPRFLPMWAWEKILNFFIIDASSEVKKEEFMPEHQSNE